MVNELPNQCSAPRELSPRGAGAERGPGQERCRLRWNLPRNHPRCQRQPQSSATEGPCPPVPPRCLFPLVPAHGRGEGAGLSSAADTRLLTSNREYLSASASATSGAETTLQSRWSAPRRERSSRPGRPALRPAPRKTPVSQSPRGEGGAVPSSPPIGKPRRAAAPWPRRPGHQRANFARLPRKTAWKSRRMFWFKNASRRGTEARQECSPQGFSNTLVSYFPFYRE